MIWLAIALVVFTLAAAIAVLWFDNMLAAVAAASVVSLGVAAMFVILEAPDVAMTEAAVGAGLSGLILALALRRVGLIRLTEAKRGEDPDA